MVPRRQPGPLALGALVSLAACAVALGCQTTSTGTPSATRGPAPEDSSVDPAPPRQPASDQPSPPEPDFDQREGELQADAVGPAKKRYVVAALGDSITDSKVGGGGYLAYLRERCPKSTFDNFGKGGDMTNQMRRRFESELLPVARSRGYDTLIVYGGVNDLYSNLTAGRTNDRIEEDLTAIYQQAQAVGMGVIAITVSPWGGFSRYFNASRSRNTQLLNAWILGGPAEGRIDAVVDSYPLLSCGDPERLCSDYETRSHDGLHPGPVGHRLLGKALFEAAFSDCM